MGPSSVKITLPPTATTLPTTFLRFPLTVLPQASSTAATTSSPAQSSAVLCYHTLRPPPHLTAVPPSIPLSHRVRWMGLMDTRTIEVALTWTLLPVGRATTSTLRRQLPQPITTPWFFLQQVTKI
ncbi:hypothetical protein RvY_17497 [Ramazzottius varieornatus]|uniref:Uncharacterized protein n=1 Tax=Ramazzottius varieornatus TaxID=947166 RepID=A0A1D1W354_RAMVA|nr:hypothetical protein RvY_17497 [Ramazzottius varieornatus]